MKKLAALVFLLSATVGSAEAKNWKTATVIGVSETKVTSPMMREAKVIVHYTVDTNDYLLLLDYTYHPATKPDSPDQPGKNTPPSIDMGGATKIAIEGHHAYLLDIHGAEVKMHIKKKTKR